MDKPNEGKYEQFNTGEEDDEDNSAPANLPEKKKEEVDYTKNNNCLHFIIKLYPNEIRLSALDKDPEKIPNQFFEESFTLSKLKKLSPFFTIFKDINECFEAVKGILEDGRFSIKRDIEKKMVLEVPLINGKNYKLNFNLELTQCKGEVDLILQEMCNNMKELFDRFNKLEEKTEEARNGAALYRDELAYEEREILRNHNELMQVYEWTIPGDKLTSKVFKRIYKAKWDGDNVAKFHEKCNGKENVLLLVEVQGKNDQKGNRFGCFSKKGWNETGNIKDPDAFVFSVEKGKKFMTSNDANSLYSTKNLGPCLGKNGEDLKIVDGFFTKQSKCNCGNTYKTDGNGTTLTGGVSDFLIKQLEVYQIIKLGD